MTRNLLIILFSVLTAVFSFRAYADRELHADYFRRIAQSENKSDNERTDAFMALLRTDSTAIEDPLAFSIVGRLLAMQEYSRADSILNIMATHPRENPSWNCHLLYLQGWSAFYQQDYSRTMEHALSLLQAKKPDSLRYRDAEAYILMSDLFNIIGNYSFGERCALRANEITGRLRRPDKTWRETQSLICLGNSQLNQGRVKEAFRSLKRARDISSDSTHLKAINGTLGMLYSASGDTAMAENYLQEAIGIPGNHINSAVLALNLAALKISQGDFRNADSVLARNAALLNNIRNANLRRGFRQTQAYLLFEKGDTEKAYLMLDSTLSLADSAYSSERSIYTRQLSSQFEKRLEEIERNNRISIRLLPWLCTLGALCAAAAIWLAIKHIRRNRRRERENFISRIKELERKLLTIEGESKADSEKSNQRLVGMAMHLARVTESLNQIYALTSEKSDSADRRMKEINGILRQLSSEDNLWEMFKTYFEQVNQSFFNNLFIIQPNLTNAEVRMSAFILMNLTSKEIASLTNRSVRTVESIKYNLRKKLGITEPTEIFMRRLATADPSSLSPATSDGTKDETV